MAGWYYIHNSNKNISSTEPTLKISTYSFDVEIEGVNCGTCTKQYKSSATSISEFRNVNQRLIFGNKNFSKVSVWCNARSNSPYGTITTWIDVTEQFIIKTSPSSGIIDLQATSNFTYSKFYVYLYVAIDEDFSTKYTVTITGTLKNCTCNYSDGEVITDDKPKIILTANNGYEFDGEFLYKYGAVTSIFKVSTDKTTLTTSISDGYNYVLNDEYIAVKKVEKIGEFTRLYNPVESELTELAKARFQNSVDMGQYITALFKIPFEIPTDLITDEKRNIVLGTLDTNVTANGLTTYNMVVDVGTITVPEKYENVYDYIDTECVLNLPYFDKIYLSNEFVIGQTVRIEYIIDLYSGNATCNIYSSFTGGIVESINGVICCNIPFVQKTNNSVVGLISNINKNIIDTAYIEVIRNKPYNVETVFGAETIDFGVIGDYTGYIEVSDVVLNSSATNEEKNEITDLLKEGITINENN